MPVNNPCGDYNDHSQRWTLVRDCVKGESSIKAGGEAYLPKPSGQTAEDYKRYSARVHFFDATGRTAEGLHGNVFSRPPAQTGETPELFLNFLANVDKAGTSIDQFASDLCWDVMQTGWGGILVDHSPAPEDLHKNEAERLQLTSFMRWYAAESVINWRYDTINDQQTLALVVLREGYETANGDEFAPTEQFRYRVLRVIDGVYTQQLYEKSENAETKKTEYLPVTDQFAPLLDGKPLDFIPFYPCPGLTPEKSMLLGLAHENIGHYQKSADFENDLHYTGIHTPYVTGMDAPTKKTFDSDGNFVSEKVIDIPVGGSNFIFLPGADGRTPTVGYLETSGSDNILHAIQACEERMAILGARIISVEKKGVETAEAARIHRAGENGVLGAFARNMSERLTLAVRLGARWRGIPDEIVSQWSYSLNIDYEGDLSQEDEKRLAMQEVDNGLMSKIRYLREFEGMDEEAAAAELEAVRAGKQGPEPDFSGLNFGGGE